MILALFLSGALASAALAQPAAAPPPGGPAESMIAEATDWLLNGEELPADTDARLRRLEPAERVRVLVFLRRSGMFSGPDWTIDRLLAPADPEVPPK